MHATIHILDEEAIEFNDQPIMGPPAIVDCSLSLATTCIQIDPRKAIQSKSSSVNSFVLVRLGIQ
jgi:hypothetical protein